MSTSPRESEAVVLDCRDHGESDLIVTLFRRDLGRLTAIAKGAKRSKKRFVNKLELFSYLNVGYKDQKGNRLAFLNEAELLSSFLNIRRDLHIYTAATVIRELLLMASLEKEEDEDLFVLLLWALQSLEERKEPKSTLVFFLIRFFTRIGYHPNLICCGLCGEEVSTKSTYAFSNSAGSLICRKCREVEMPTSIHLSQGTIKILQAAQKQPLERLHRLKLSGPTLKESLNLLHRYGCHLFQRDIKSWKMMLQYKEVARNN